MSDIKAKVDGLLAKAVATGHVPGVAAMVVNRQGVLYEGGFGKRVLGQEAEMGIDTVVWIASMTKAVTAAAVMQLVEQGRLELDAPASDVVPAIANIPVLIGFDAQGQPLTRSPKRAITLRHLLTHTAGFGYDTWNAEVGRYATAMGLPNMQSGQERALQTALLFDPGERWNYSIGIDHAAKMLQVVTGMRLGDYLQEHLFGPLGMNDTAFKIRPDMRSRMAKVHQRGDAGVLSPLMEMEILQDPQIELGGGGLYSSVADYAKFVQMILNRGQGNGQQVLKPETVDLMSRNAMGESVVTELKSVLPTRSRNAEFFPGLRKNWGLSFQINQDQAPTGRSAGSLSWAGLSNCYYWIDPTRGIAGVYATQILPFADVRSLPLFLDFETAVYQNLE